MASPSATAMKMRHPTRVFSRSRIRAFHCGMGTSPFAIDLAGLKTTELFSAYGAIMDELRRREIVRSSNSPLSDYAELLFCKAFGWKRERNSAAGYDAVDESTGVRSQIKGRRLTPHNASRQLSAIRNLDATPFDELAGVLVDEEFQVVRAALVPVAVVRAKSVHVAHTNSWKFLLRDAVWIIPGVRDVTEELKAAASTI
jgi:hypothetical protein